MKKSYLILFISFLFLSCVAVPIKSNDFSITLKNNTDKICYYNIDWVDHNYREHPNPVNIAGGELKSGKTYTLLNRREPGHYYIVWMDNQSRKNEKFDFYGKGGDEVSLEFNGYIAKEKKPTDAPFTYSELMMWHPGGFLGTGELLAFEDDPHNGKRVYVYTAVNPDNNSEWMGMFAYICVETGEMLRIALIKESENKFYLYSIIDEELQFLENLDIDAEQKKQDKSYGI